MKTLSALLALTDLSPPSRHAVVRAAMLAKETNSKLDLLHVLEGGALEQLRALLGQEATSVTECLLDDVRASLAELADATAGRWA